jgi:hypothetical protein
LGKICKIKEFKAMDERHFKEDLKKFNFLADIIVNLEGINYDKNMLNSFLNQIIKKVPGEVKNENIRNV